MSSSQSALGRLAAANTTSTDQARASHGTFGTTRCTFVASWHPDSHDNGNTEQAGVLNLASWANQTPMTLSVNSPAEIAVHLFQRMVRDYDRYTLE